MTIFENPVHHNARFTATQVLDIRRRAAEGEPKANLAREFGCDRTIIDNIVNRVTYAKVEDRYRPSPQNRPGPKGKLTEDDVRNIIDLLDGGIPGAEIARKFDVDHRSISDIKVGRNHKTARGSARESRSTGVSRGAA